MNFINNHKKEIGKMEKGEILKNGHMLLIYIKNKGKEKKKFKKIYCDAARNVNKLRVRIFNNYYYIMLYLISN